MSAFALEIAKKIADAARKEFALRLLERITDDEAVQVINEELARFNRKDEDDEFIRSTRKD